MRDLTPQYSRPDPRPQSAWADTTVGRYGRARCLPMAPSPALQRRDNAMHPAFILRGSAAALLAAGLLGCASKSTEPMVMTSATSHSSATSTTTVMAPLSRD